MQKVRLCGLEDQRSSQARARHRDQNWRCLHVNQLTNAAFLDTDEWHSYSEHSEPQTCVDQVIVEIPYPY